VGPRGWVGVRIDGKVDWSVVSRLVTQAYGLVAPRGCAKPWMRRRRRQAGRGRAEAGGGTVGAMRSPVRHLPSEIEGWMSRMRWLRWLDGAATALVLWSMLALVLEGVPPIGWRHLAGPGRCRRLREPAATALAPDQRARGNLGEPGRQAG
jgi:hypothetical protein